MGTVGGRDPLPTSPFQGEEFVAGFTEAATSERR